MSVKQVNQRTRALPPAPADAPSRLRPPRDRRRALWLPGADSRERKAFASAARLRYRLKSKGPTEPASLKLVLFAPCESRSPRPRRRRRTVTVDTHTLATQRVLADEAADVRAAVPHDRRAPQNR